MDFIMKMAVFRCSKNVEAYCDTAQYGILYEK